MTSFFEDEFDRLDNGLKETISETKLRKMKEKFFNTICDFEDTIFYQPLFLVTFVLSNSRSDILDPFDYM